jgi:hypothetical protein
MTIGEFLQALSAFDLVALEHEARRVDDQVTVRVVRAELQRRAREVQAEQAARRGAK